MNTLLSMTNPSGEWNPDWLELGIRVHRTATVDCGAVLGRGSVVWHYSHLRSSCVIGEQCTIGQGCYVDADVQIGSRCKIANTVQMYSGLKIGDEVFIGPNTTFTNDSWPRAAMNGELIQFSSPERTLVESGASIGAGCVILPVRIGVGAMIGAGSVVTCDIPDYTRLICRLTMEMEAISNGQRTPTEGA